MGRAAAPWGARGARSICRNYAVYDTLLCMSVTTCCAGDRGGGVAALQPTRRHPTHPRRPSIPLPPPLALLLPLSPPKGWWSYRARRRRPRGPARPRRPPRPIMVRAPTEECVSSSLPLLTRQQRRAMGERYVPRPKPSPSLGIPAHASPPLLAHAAAAALAAPALAAATADDATAAALPRTGAPRERRGQMATSRDCNLAMRSASSPLARV